MQSLRILIVTHAPLSRESGAGQMAINLAEALRAQGHSVTLWSPYPMQPVTRWWQEIQSFQTMRSKLNEFLETRKTFDVIDCYPLLLTKKVSNKGFVIARSVQPEILYKISQLHSLQQKGFRRIVLQVFIYFSTALCIFLLLQSWKRANQILCLGSLELEWMKRWFPFWRSKLKMYNNALSENDQVKFSEIRDSRQDFKRKRSSFCLDWPMGRPQRNN